MMEGGEVCRRNSREKERDREKGEDDKAIVSGFGDGGREREGGCLGIENRKGAVEGETCSCKSPRLS